MRCFLCVDHYYDGMKHRYAIEDLRKAVTTSTSYAGVLRCLGIKQAGGSQNYIKRRISEEGIDTSHFTGKAHQKGQPCNNGIKKTVEEILVLLPEGSYKPRLVQLRRALKECGVKEECKMCGLGIVWNDLPIRLEIDHINGNWLDNRIENLQYLCPNCHYQKTWVLNQAGVA